MSAKKQLFFTKEEGRRKKEEGRRKKSVGCATSTENIVSEALVEDRPSAV
ncbi:hypothetical protein Q5692_11690 [Microcoleus sp. C2C3]